MGSSGKILITGAAGFVGAALCRHLAQKKIPLRAVVRRGGTPLPADLKALLDDVVAVSEVTRPEAWSKLLTEIEVVVHLAARAHCLVSDRRSEERFFSDNLEMSRALAQGAVKAGVRRLIFLSTIKVNGEGVLAPGACVYGPGDRPRPRGAYAVSKWRAEQELNRLCVPEQGPELVIIRSPLVYGPGVKGNFAALLAWLDRGRPLPVARTDNQRSFISLDNLVDFLEFSCFHPQAGGRLLFPADERDCSSRELAHLLARALERPFRSCSLPIGLMKFSAALLGQSAALVKLMGNLQLDRSSVAELGWRAPERVETGLTKTANWWRQVGKKRSA
ncbi:MAG TPA: NAD-dependent epimerase/dehydratase family protein [Proteobacteria bacterium]|nr:NAD-dependent epimerase/dehydratase family protein [Pseudomonadota bacterium]